jgi:hypothetical protein
MFIMKPSSLLFFIALFLFCHCGHRVKNNSDLSAEKTQPDSCCMKKEEAQQASLQSEITCPECGYKKTESMPSDICLISYTCERCKTVLHPREGDCCVFCTYGTVKCPSKQE